MSLVRKETFGSVAVVSLNRPGRHNSLTPDLLGDLLATIRHIGGDKSIDAIVLRAEGPSFSTGGDVRGFYEAEDLAQYASTTVGLLNEVMLAMANLAQPLISAVHGIVTGGSLGLLLASDVVLVTPEATITPWYSVVGFSPDGGWTAILPGIIGKQRAIRVLLTNETITPSQALEWGLAAEIVAQDEIVSRARALAEEVAAGKRGAVVSTKRLLNRKAIASALEAERAAFVAQILTSEARTGMAEFLGEQR